MKSRNLIFVSSLAAATLIAAGGGCANSSNGTVSDGTGSEVAITALGGASQASEGTLAANSAPASSSRLAKLSRALNPLPQAWAVPLCDWSSVISSCNSNSETLSFDGCSDLSDHAISIKGSETLTWTGEGCCNSNPLMASSLTPCSFIRRTINASGSADPLTLSVGRNEVSMNTEDTSGYETPLAGGFVVTCQGADGINTCDGQRQIAILGAHYKGAVGPAKWDHTVSTEIPVIVQGHGSGRRVLSGTVRVQHNLAKTTSVTKITQTLTHSAGCCYPTGGEVTTTFKGGNLNGKSETVVFGPTCGEATLNNTSEQKTGLTLHHCL